MVLEKQALLLQILRRLASPLVAILVLACIISAVVGDVENAVIIAAIVVLSTVIESVQTHRSHLAAAALQVVAQTATVFRDGRCREVPRRELVPDDVDPALGGRHGARRRLAARREGPPCERGGADRRVAAGRENAGASTPRTATHRKRAGTACSWARRS